MARQCRRCFAWPAFHPRVLTVARAPRSAVLSAPEAACLPPSGHQTCGLGPCCNGCPSRAERGLDSSTRAGVAVTRRGACTRAVAQTPPGAAETGSPPAQAETRVACSRQPRRAPRHRLPPQVPSHGVAGYDAKKQYLDAVVRRTLQAIPTVRSAADGGCLSTGPPPKRRGARRTYAGQVTCPAGSRFEALGTRAEAPPLPLETAVVWPQTLTRRWRLVVRWHRQDLAQRRCLVLGAPAPERHGPQRVARYAARLQSAWLCRDRTPCTGLRACPARAAAALDVQCNAALATRNLARTEPCVEPTGESPQVFSMASWKQRHFHE